MPRMTSRLFPVCILTALLSFAYSVPPADAQTTAATPMFSPAAGTYSTGQSVTISDTTPGAVVHCTLDWTTPTANSPVCSGLIPIGQNTTVKAIAVAAGYHSSPIALASYVIRTAEPTYSPAPGLYPAAQPVRLTDTTPGAKIYYTLDNTEPSASSTPYTGPITIGKDTIVTAVAYAPGYGAALSTMEIYQIRAATPTLNPPPGNYTGLQPVAINDTTPGAQIYYTLDNSQPTISSPDYSTPIVISQNTIIHAVAYAPGYAASFPTSALQYTFPTVVRAAPPIFSVPGGTYTTTQTVGITDSTPGAVIHYTTDGSTPYPWSQQYSGPIPVSRNKVLRAIAAASGFNESVVVSGSYQFQPADPVFSISAGGYLHTVKPTITEATPGATIYYTTDGSTPGATHGTVIGSGGSILVAANETVNAVAIAAIPGWATASNVISNSYAIDPSSTMPQEWTLMNNGHGKSVPGLRNSAATWTDPNGNVWLFGGANLSAFHSNYNDMWMFNPTTNDWTMINGTGSTHYGTLGVADGANLPEARISATTWTDKNGNFWMFGGFAWNPAYIFAGDDLNDVWMFNPNAPNAVTGANGVWTWMGGTQVLGDQGTYGTKGVAGGANIPAARSESVAWTDGNGNFWLFGGNGSDFPYLNDLWEFMPNASNSVTGVSGVWTWMGGDSTFSYHPGIYNSEGIANDSSYPGGRNGANGWMDASGNFWLFGGNGMDSSVFSQYPLNDLWEYNPNAANSKTGVNGVWTWESGSDFGGQMETASSPGLSVEAPGWKDSTGNFWAFMVNNYRLIPPNFSSYPMPDMWSFNPTNNEWTRESNWNIYGSDPVIEFAPSPSTCPMNAWVDPYWDGWDVGFFGNASEWTDANGYLWLFATYSEVGGQQYNYVWMYDPDPPVPTPVIGVASGTYTAPLSVTITDTDAATTIYYTTDGSTPTTSSSVYHGPIAVSANATVVALAISGRADSQLAAATYSF